MARVTHLNFSKVVDDADGERTVYFRHCDLTTHVLKTREQAYVALRAFSRKQCKPGESETAAESRLLFQEANPEALELYEIYKILPAEKQETEEPAPVQSRTWAKIEAMAKDLVSKGMAQTLPIAIDKVTMANPELYEQYQAETKPL